MYFLNVGPNLPETALTLRAARLPWLTKLAVESAG